MLPEIEKLLVLQDRDRKIRTLNQELKLVPLERKEIETRFASTSTALDKAKQKAREIEIEINKLKLEAQSKRDQIAKYETQKMQTRKNEEYAAFNHQIELCQRDIQTIEDRELDFMEASEKAKVEVANAEKDFSNSKGMTSEQLADLDAKLVTIQSSLKDLDAGRAKLAAEIDEDLLSRYDRLFTSKGDAAVVPLEHEVCMGCHMKITTQTAVRVKGQKEIVGCEQCGRILYANQ